ncbi:MAG: hypothetical protein ACRCWF_17900 [Beijerinckiaceae bacterium]
MQKIRSRWTVFAAALAATGAVCVLLANPSVANNSMTEKRQTMFIITDQEGYGTGECLEKDSACGKIIADSFCESKGFKVAQFYRKAAADDVTGSISSERRSTTRDPQAFIISCK